MAALPHTKIDLDHALQLRTDGATKTEIAKVFDCSLPAVIQAFKAYDNRPDVIQETMAQEFEKLGLRVLASITDKDLEKASLQQKTTSAGIIVDKIRLLRGQTTGKETSISILVGQVTPQIAQSSPTSTKPPQPDVIDIDPLPNTPQPSDTKG